MARSTVRRDDGTRRPKVTGKIRTLRVDKGFGFIKDDTGKECPAPAMIRTGG
jgi:hypothetical protein